MYIYSVAYSLGGWCRQASIITTQTEKSEKEIEAMLRNSFPDKLDEWPASIEIALITKEIHHIDLSD